MKIKTSELIGPALDWAVAKCEGENSVASCYYAEDNTPLYLDEAPEPTWHPSTNWAQGGPIIEREKIGVWWDGIWHAKYDGCLHEEVQDADDPLLAAMRCYVASKLGDEIEIPEEPCSPSS